MNNAFDDDVDGDDFFDGDGDVVIANCFKAVLRQNVHNDNIMAETFRQWVVQFVSAAFQWPTNNRLGNAFNYLHEQYIDNVKTNIRTHYKKRLKLYFTMRAYTMNIIRRENQNAILFDDDDIKNAINHTANGYDSTNGDVNRIIMLDILLEDLRLFGAPADCNIRDFVENNWFKSLKMWINIQRDIEHFNKVYANLRRDWNLFRKYPLYVTRPFNPAPPDTNNFAAIPLCSNQRRHIRIDTAVLYGLLCEIGIVPKKIGQKKSKPEVNVTRTDFFKNQTGGWRLFFDGNKIDQMVHNKKLFDTQIISDGVSATILYLRPNQPEAIVSKEEVRRLFDLNTFWYHFDTKQGVRNNKAEKMTRLFTFDEQCDRNAASDRIGQMPSSRDSSWPEYIQHRLRVMENGIETYSSRNYARLRLDKYIEWHRAIDQTAGALVNHKPAIIFLGAGQIAANSIISIRKHVRCPGTRKLIEAFKKRANCIVIMVDEYLTSQHCARCLQRFHRRTKSYRHKKCENCQPNEILLLPTTIVTNVSKRALQIKRSIMKVWREMRDMGNGIAAILTQSNAKRLVSKKRRFLKTWQPNPNVIDGEDGDAAQQQPSQRTTVWHRDVCAAKLILYRGE